MKHQVSTTPMARRAMERAGIDREEIAAFLPRDRAITLGYSTNGWAVRVATFPQGKLVSGFDPLYSGSIEGAIDKALAFLDEERVPLTGFDDWSFPGFQR